MFILNLIGQLTGVDQFLYTLFNGRGALGNLLNDLDVTCREIRVETSLMTVTDGTRAPQVPSGAKVVKSETYDGNRIVTFRR